MKLLCVFIVCYRNIRSLLVEELQVLEKWENEPHYKGPVLAFQITGHIS